MILKCGLILLSFYTFLPKTWGDETPWGPEEDIEFNALSYEDACKEVAEAEWSFINNPTNHTLLAWKYAQANYSSFKKKEVESIHNQTNLQSPDESLSYQISVAEKPGDTLLNSTGWDKLISFSGEAAIIRTGTNDTDGTENISRREVEKFLSGNAKVEDKRSAWSRWHRRLLPLEKNFSSTLQLVSEAAKANDIDSVAAYWELLSGYPEGYERIKSMWEEIAELHKKLVNFVQKRLAQRYKITLSNSTIPAYLLGSLDGNDWTSVAADVMPYGNITYSVIKSLWDKNLRGITLYKSASAMGKSVLKQVPHADFWHNSRFNHTCSTQLVNFCLLGATRVITCHQASLNNYLTAHKVIAKAVMSQMRGDGTDNSVFNTANRYSGLDEGVAEFFSILSMSPGQLVALKLIDNSTDTEQSKISSLMITALDVLPRLAYYIAADLWRIDAIKSGNLEPKQLLESWWKYRAQYEGVASDSSDIPTFLDDEFITSNKPYLPKFVGTVLSFQLYEHLTESTEVRYDTVAQYQTKPELVSMLKNGGADDWMKVISHKLGLYEVSANSLTTFFAPLVDYLDSEPEDIYSLTPRQESELFRLQELYGSSDVTTPVPTTTSVPPSKSKHPKKSNSTTPVAPPVIPTVKSSLGDKIIKDKKESDFKGDTEVPKDAGSEYTGSMNTSKAVWVVAAVLVATVTICIIAIFGRRRCVKSQAPKNRRYV